MMMNIINAAQTSDTAQAAAGAVQPGKTQPAAQGMFAMLLAALTGQTVPSEMAEPVPLAISTENVTGDEEQTQENAAGGAVSSQNGEVVTVADVNAPALDPVSQLGPALLLPTTTAETVVPETAVSPSATGETALPVVPTAVQDGRAIASVELHTSEPGLMQVDVEGGNEVAWTRPGPVPAAAVSASIGADGQTAGASAVTSEPGEVPVMNLASAEPVTQTGPAPLVYAADARQTGNAVAAQASPVSSGLVAETGEVRDQLQTGETRTRQHLTPSGQTADAGKEPALAAGRVVTAAGHISPQTTGSQKPESSKPIHIASVESLEIRRATPGTTVPEPVSQPGALAVGGTDKAQSIEALSDKIVQLAASEGQVPIRTDETAVGDQSGAGKTEVGEVGLLVKTASSPSVARPGPAAGAGEPLPTRPSTLVDQVVTSVRSIRTDDRTEMRIRLNPPHLGELQIRVVHEGDALRVQLTAENGLARDLLEARMPELRNALAEIRGTTSDLNVTVTTGDGAPSTSMATGDGGTRTPYQQQPGKPYAEHGETHTSQPEQFNEWRRGHALVVNEGHIDVHA
jgi:flagellar hook-length control protein FliK